MGQSIPEGAALYILHHDVVSPIVTVVMDGSYVWVAKEPTDATFILELGLEIGVRLVKYLDYDRLPLVGCDGFVYPGSSPLGDRFKKLVFGKAHMLVNWDVSCWWFGNRLYRWRYSVVRKGKGEDEGTDLDSVSRL